MTQPICAKHGLQLVVLENQNQLELFYRKSTIVTTIVAIGTNNDMYCLHKRIEKFPLQTSTPYKTSMERINSRTKVLC